jgi:uncharacterized protein YegL
VEEVSFLCVNCVCKIKHNRSVGLPWALANGYNSNPRDPRVMEAICFTRGLDDWFVQKRAKDADYWKLLLGTTEPPLNSMFFGSHHGPFRIYPARQSEGCGDFEAHLRPWYIAGSSGPKNVVLMLDTSGTMEGERLSLLKEASKRVVNTLTIYDRITVVTFSSNATAYTADGGYMFKATADNKQILSDAIDSLTAVGGTNYYEAFDKAFNVLDATIANELNSPCNTAVIFLTDDGDRNQELGNNLTEVTRLVTTRMSQVSAAIQKPALLFTYSLSYSSNDDASFDANVFPAQLACAVEYGVWSKVSNDHDLTEALSNYYRLFALGLGAQDQNDPFVAWVEPYVSATPSNTMVTTVSRPCYDRTSSPAIFLGVVGIDVDLRALNAALGSGITATDKDTISHEVIRRIVNPSDNRCPRELNLTACELEAYQASSHSYHGLGDGDGDENNKNQSSSSLSFISFCDRGCTDLNSVRVQESACQDLWVGGFYPDELWNNTHFLLHKDTPYTDRFCCKNNSAEEKKDDVCLSAAIPTSRPATADSSGVTVDENSTSISSTNGDVDTGDGGSGSGLRNGAIAGIALSLAAVVAAGLLSYVARKRGFFSRVNKTEGEHTLPPPINPYALWHTSAPTGP